MLQLALRNAIRHRTRSALSIAVIAFGVASLIVSGGFVEDIFYQLGEALIHSQSGHLQVFRKGYYEQGTRSPEKYAIPRPGQVKQLLESRNEVAGTMSRLSFSGMLNNGKSDLAILGEGVEAEKEKELGSYQRFLAGRELMPDDQFSVVIGTGVAHALKLSPGDYVTLIVSTADGALNNLEFKVAGIFQTFSKDYDARAVRMPLTAAKELLNTTGVTNIVVRLRETSETGTIVDFAKTQLTGQGYEVRNWVELNSFYEKTVALYKQQFGALRVIILIAVLLGVANTVSMNVLERIGEFGTIMSLGYKSRYIFQLILGENLLLGLAGTSLGITIGVGLALMVSMIGIPMPPPPNADIGYTAHIQIHSLSVLGAAMVGMASAVLASIVPARRASTTPIAEALRRN